MSTKTITLTTTSNPSPSELDTFLTLLSRSYLRTPLTTSFITEIDQTPPPYPSTTLTPSRLKSHFEQGITRVCQSNVLMIFATPEQGSTPLAAALFEPPAFTGIPHAQAWAKPGPCLSEYRVIAAKLKSTHLSIPESGPGSWDTPAAPSQSSAAPSEDPYPVAFNKDASVETRPFYHLAFLGQNIEPDTDQWEVHAAVRKIVKDIQDRAREEEVCVWLTTSEEVGMKQYGDMGFAVKEEVKVGKGRVDARGWPSEGDEAVGVSVWALYWE